MKRKGWGICKIILLKSKLNISLRSTKKVNYIYTWIIHWLPLQFTVWYVICVITIKGNIFGAFVRFIWISTCVLSSRFLKTMLFLLAGSRSLFRKDYDSLFKIVQQKFSFVHLNFPHHISFFRLILRTWKKLDLFYRIHIFSSELI